MMLIQLGLRLLLANVGSQEKEMDNLGLSPSNSVKSESVVPTETCLNTHISDQAVTPDGRTLF